MSESKFEAKFEKLRAIGSHLMNARVSIPASRGRSLLHELSE
jgi:hypothetical protein